MLWDMRKLLFYWLDRGSTPRLRFTATEQFTAVKARDVAMPIIERHNLPIPPRLGDANRVRVTASDQRSRGRDLDNRTGCDVRCWLLGCSEHFNVKAGHRIKSRDIAGRGEGLVIAGAYEVEDSRCSPIPVDPTIEGIAMAVEAAQGQILRYVGELFA